VAANVSVTYNFVAGTPAVADNVDQNFTDIVNWVNTNAVHLDGSKAFTAVPSGPASDPTSANQLTRKAYVDAKFSTCLSSARPGSPVAGQMIFETDKNRVRVYSGSAWLLVSGTQAVSASNTGQVVATGATGTLTFATKNYDTDSFFTAGGSTFTIPEDGTYAVTVKLTQTAGNNFVQGFGSYGLLVAPSGNYPLPPSTHYPTVLMESYVIPFSASNTFTVTFTNGSNAGITFDASVVVRRIGD
jgi:hypothetical protein